MKVNGEEKLREMLHDNEKMDTATKIYEWSIHEYDPDFIVDKATGEIIMDIYSHMPVKSQQYLTNWLLAGHTYDKLAEDNYSTTGNIRRRLNQIRDHFQYRLGIGIYEEYEIAKLGLSKKIFKYLIRSNIKTIAELNNIFLYHTTLDKKMYGIGKKSVLEITSALLHHNINLLDEAEFDMGPNIMYSSIQMSSRYFLTTLRDIAHGERFVFILFDAETDLEGWESSDAGFVGIFTDTELLNKEIDKIENGSIRRNSVLWLYNKCDDTIVSLLDKRYDQRKMEPIRSQISYLSPKNEDEEEAVLGITFSDTCL